MKIGELARMTHSTPETVRYYEKEGLLAQPARTDGNYRNYGPEHVERLRFIRNCRALDMTHEEIRVLLQAMDAPDAGCASANAMVDEHIGHIDARISELQSLKAQLTTLRARCSGDGTGDCGILTGLTQLQTSDTPTRQTHLG
ncbi:MAG: Cd(II)/Pb(II)-responsive transcriptional regulator [Comamonadaceae bacterium]|nr:MAG: Cd(II)/Pb(II)-responsive transcriptional regulator [Comamonadaceae bacterium]